MQSGGAPWRDSRGPCSEGPGKIRTPCVIRGVRAVGAPWQDSCPMHDSRGQCGEKGPSLARSSRDAFPKGDLQGILNTWRAYLAKASSFWIHGGDMLPRRASFPVRGPFWDAWGEGIATDCRPGTHRARILPRIAARERIRAESCHRQPPAPCSAAYRQAAAFTGTPAGK